MSFGGILYNIIIMPLYLLFEFVYHQALRVLENRGLSIIALSLAINLLVLPLYRRADAMQEEERDIEAKLAPGVKHIKQTFRGDERTMMLQEFYRRNNYSPLYVLRSAVSLFLEIPFFIAAYRYLSELTILNGVSFGPIRDLGAQDHMLTVFGIAINVLPILMTLINAVSTAIFTKGYPLKTKIQLYGMAAFFLVFLYDSPSGLVFYWTLNNLFSLIKTICYKLKNPKKLLSSAGLVVGVIMIGMAVNKFLHWKSGPRIGMAMNFAIGFCLCVPFVLDLYTRKYAKARKVSSSTPDKHLFTLCMFFLTVLLGALIPSAVVAAGPQEFLDTDALIHPMWFVVGPCLIAAGTFLLWAGIFDRLAASKSKVMFERVGFMLCAVAVANYLFFSVDYGSLSTEMTFERLNLTSLRLRMLNIGVLVAVGIAALFIAARWKKVARYAVTVGSLTLCCMVAINSVGIIGSVAAVDRESLTGGETRFPLSRSGRNVVVLMLDRALGAEIPYIFNEKPELQEQFSGFMYYSNVVSFGTNTNFGTPGLYGGYEYTPLEMNKRDTELLVDKQNEALKVMPVIFAQEGYRVTVCDPNYAGYQFSPDLSIYDEYPEIHASITMGRLYGEDSDDQDPLTLRSRNAFWYAIMRSAPLELHPMIYDKGRYGSTSSGALVRRRFLTSFSVLKHLPVMSEVEDGDFNTFMMMANETTHEIAMLQEPEYLPSDNVDNTEYDATHTDRFTIGDRSINVTTDVQLKHYQVNMAAMIQLGKWFDYLRAEGAYDNTRIILVADHGYHLGEVDQFLIPEGDLENFYPLLMVKDFNAEGFTTSTDFMTNADVPTLATAELVKDPTNPFTGKAINSDAKDAPELYLFASNKHDPTKNNGTQFLPGTWVTVHTDIWNPDNWKVVAKNAVLP